MIYHELYAFELKIKSIINRYSLIPINRDKANEEIKKELDEIFIHHSNNSITYIIDEIEVKLTGFTFDFKLNELIIIPYWSVA